MSTNMPDPSATQVTAWLQTISRDFLQNDGWKDASFRFAGIVSGAQTFAKEHFADNLEQQEAFFDGVAIALTALGHFADYEQVSALLREETVAHEELPITPLQLPATATSTRRKPETTA